MRTFMLAFAAMAATATTALAQPPMQATGANEPPRIVEPPSNLELGVSMDRYIGDPSKGVPRMSREAIMTRSIFTEGNPDAAGAPGAVLRFRKEVVLGTMEPGEATPISTMPEQQLIYVKGGRGRIDDGNQVWDLKDGYAVLIPPNQAHRLSSTGDEPLQMIMLSALPREGVTAPRGIVVRDTAKLLYVEQGAHWNNFSKAPFRDLGERLLIVHLGPMTFAGPHSHTQSTEELWVKITDGPALMQVGSEIRWWNENVGLFAPNNYKTVHAAINTSNKRQAWFYIQGNGPSSPAEPTPPAPGARITPGNNPVIAQAMKDATIAGRPLNPPAARR